MTQTTKEVDGRTAVLVTGGAGYIGSHTCKALAQAGYLPVTFDSLEHGHRWAVRWGPLVEGNLSDADHVRRVLRDIESARRSTSLATAYVGESPPLQGEGEGGDGVSRFNHKPPPCCPSP